MSVEVHLIQADLTRGYVFCSDRWTNEWQLAGTTMGMCHYALLKAWTLAAGNLFWQVELLDEP